MNPNRFFTKNRIDLTDPYVDELALLITKITLFTMVNKIY